MQAEVVWELCSGDTIAGETWLLYDLRHSLIFFSNIAFATLGLAMDTSYQETYLLNRVAF